MYEDAIAALLERGKPADIREALDYAERSRSRLLLERMQTAAQAAPLTSENLPFASSAGDLAELTALRAEISRAYYRMNALDEEIPRRFAGNVSSSPEAVAELETAYRARLQESALLNSAAHCGPAFAAAPFSRQAAQSVLLPDETLIEYFVAADAVSAFVLTRSGLRAARNIACVEEVTAAARRLRFQLQRVETQPAHVARYAHQMQAAIDDALQNLYNLLLRPLEPFLNPKLVIAPHGLLHGLPFHAFHDGAKYAVERFEMVYAPSAAIFSRGAAAFPLCRNGVRRAAFRDGLFRTQYRPRDRRDFLPCRIVSRRAGLYRFGGDAGSVSDAGAGLPLYSSRHARAVPRRQPAFFRPAVRGRLAHGA